MPVKKITVDDLFRADSHQVLRDSLARWAQSPSLLQAQQLTDYARSLLPEPGAWRLAIVHTYTSDLLAPWLDFQASLQGLAPDIHHAPYGLALDEAAPDSALVRHRPDTTLLMLQRDDLDPQLAHQPLAGLDADALAALRRRALDRLREIVSAFRRQPVGQVVVTLLPALRAPALGLHDAQSAWSEQAWWQATKNEFCAWLRAECPGGTFLDVDDVVATVGRQAAFDRRYWYSARYPFSAAASCELARRIVAIDVALRQPKAKVLVLDADNTLWGGVVGEDGPDGISLGPDHPGNCYVDFQRRLLDFQRRGLILALCSKNNPGDLQSVLDIHPHQILRDEHFAARRVNWEPKPENLKSLARELNVGLDSLIFVDDSDHECAAVRDALPEVEVVQTPARAVDVPGCLDHVARLEILSLTAEDLAKTAMYAHERMRREIMQPSEPGATAGDAHLARLGMRMTVAVDPKGHLARLAQLTKKTNQFNLTTRRYDETQMAAFIEGSETVVFDFSLADVFGDSGIVGLAIWRLVVSAGQDAGAERANGLGTATRSAPARRAELDTFLMSCRVIGRRAESAFLASTLRWLRARGVDVVDAWHLPTAKNALVKDFLGQHGFRPADDAGRMSRDLRESPPESADRYPIETVVAISP